MPFNFGDEPMNVGDWFGSQCMVGKGDLPVDIYWTLNSHPITNGNEGFALIRTNPRTSSLNINALEGKHRGIYQCIANNKAGSATYTAELHVNG